MENIEQGTSKNRRFILDERRHISPSYSRECGFVFHRGKGTHVWDLDGNKYLDFSAAIAVNALGHRHPHVVHAIKDQLRRGNHAAYPDFHADTPLAFIKELKRHLPPKFNTVFLSNSGTESVEAALKLAKWHSGKKYLIAFTPCFHGRTMGSLSMTNSKKIHRQGFHPFLPVKHSPYPYSYRSGRHPNEESTYCLQRLKKLLQRKDIAAVFFEPIAGEGGYIVPPKKFVQGLRKLCTTYNVLLVADEVQSGCYRTGEFLACRSFGILPDIVCLSKAIGGGLPLGVTAAPKSIMKWPAGSHSNTFGGNLLACASGKATLQVLQKFRENIRIQGAALLSGLQQMQQNASIIGDVRGKGLMIGVEFFHENTVRNVLHHCYQAGLLLLPAGDKVIRFCPPLNVSRQEVNRGLAIFSTAVQRAR